MSTVRAVLIANLLNLLIIMVLGTLQLAMAEVILHVHYHAGIHVIRSNPRQANLLEVILLISMVETAFICGGAAAHFDRNRPLLAGLLASVLWPLAHHFARPHNIGDHIDVGIINTVHYSVFLLGLIGAYFYNRRYEAKRVI
nr:hypothetical protein [uncultured Lichenicoccus sp.]